MVVVGKNEISKAIAEAKRFRKLVFTNRIPSADVDISHVRAFFGKHFTVEKFEKPTDNQGNIIYLRILIMNIKRTFAVRIYIGEIKVVDENKVYADKYFDLTVIPRQNQRMTGAGKAYLEKAGFEELTNHFHKQYYGHDTVYLGQL